MARRLGRVLVHRTDGGERGRILGRFHRPYAVELNAENRDDENTDQAEHAHADAPGGQNGFGSASGKGFKHFGAEIKNGVVGLAQGLELTEDFFRIEAEFACVDAKKAAGVSQAGKFVVVTRLKAANHIEVQAGAGGGFLDSPTEAKTSNSQLGGNRVSGFGHLSAGRRFFLHNWTVSRSTKISRSLAPSRGPIIPRLSN